MKNALWMPNWTVQTMRSAGRRHDLRSVVQHFIYGVFFLLEHRAARRLEDFDLNDFHFVTLGLRSPQSAALPFRTTIVLLQQPEVRVVRQQLGSPRTDHLRMVQTDTSFPASTVGATRSIA